MILAKSTGISLKEHTENVLRAVKALSDGSIDWKLVEIAAKFHDAGKVYPGFQRKMKNSNSDLPDVPHSFLSVVFIPLEILRNLSDEDRAIIMSAVAFHHWRESFLDYLMGRSKENMKRAFRWLLENREVIEELKKEIKEAGFNEELAEYLSSSSLIDSGVIIPPQLVFTLPSFVLSGINIEDEVYRKYVFVSGNLKRADRFASFFEQSGKVRIEDIEIEYEGDKNETIREKLRSIGVDDPWQLKYLEDKSAVLIAPTGSGKTEYALLWSKGKTILTIPIRSAVNSIYNRLVKYFGEENVGLLHSNADLVLFQEKGKNLSYTPELEGEILKNVELSRFLSYPFVVTTGDQIFPAALKYPDYDMIYSTLMRSSLVVDEVQAYDPRSAAIIVKMLEDVRVLGGRFLLMTATLPKFIEREIIERTDVENPIDVYSEVSGSSRSIISVVGGNDETILKIAEKHYKERKRVLIIRNTVSKALKIYDALKKKGLNVDIIHSRMTFSDRRIKEEKIEKFQPGSSYDEPAVLITTQVAEASLNIDFDVLVSDIAPADSLVQRMGRVYRKREYEGSKPNVYIVVQESEKHGIEYFRGVYGKDQIVLTAQWLCFQDIPDKIRKLDSLIGKIFRCLRKSPTLELDDTKKKEFVEGVYDSLENSGSSYIRRFRETLQLLDDGYISEKRSDAQRVFRNVVSVDVVPENLVKEMLRDLENAAGILEIKRIINDYTLSVPAYEESLRDKMEFLPIEDETAKRFLRFIPVLKGVFYEHGVGLR